MNRRFITLSSALTAAVALLPSSLLASAHATQHVVVQSSASGGASSSSSGSSRSSAGGTSGAASDSRQSSESTSTTTVAEDGLEVSITETVKSGVDAGGQPTQNRTSQTSVRLDGKVVPDNRLRRNGNRLEILDEQGQVIRSIDVPVAGVQVFGGQGAGGAATRLFRSRSGQGNVLPGFAIAAPPGGPTMVAARPNVMLGVTMDSIDEPLAQTLGVKPEEVTLLATVMPDLPAANAGLKPFDVVVSVDGQKPASPARIREILRSKSAGETVTLGVISEGNARDVTVNLEAWDPLKMGQSGSGGMMRFGNDPLVGGFDPRYEEEIRAAMEQLRQTMQGMPIQIEVDDLFAPMPAQPAQPAQPGSSNILRFRTAPASPLAPNAAAPGGAASNAAVQEEVELLRQQIRELQESVRMLKEQLRSNDGATQPARVAPAAPRT